MPASLAHEHGSPVLLLRFPRQPGVSKTQGSIARIHPLKARPQHAHSVGLLRRSIIFLTAFACAFAAAPAASAHGGFTLEECDLGPPVVVGPPCVVSVKKDGAAIPYNAASGGSDDLVVAMHFHVPGDPTSRFNFSISAPDGSFTLNTAKRYEVALNLGGVYPGETFARGHDVKVDRTVVGGHNIVTFTQNPVRMADDSCTGAGVCSMTATRTSTGYLDGWIDNLTYISDAADRTSMRGFDLASNVDWVSSPLELDDSTNSIFLRVANAHFEGPPSPAGTLFVGSAEFKLPFPMLRRLYEVDDPASLTPAAFSVTGAGSAATTDVDVDATGHTVHVQLEGLTFSRRRLRILGDTRPGRPQGVVARRLTSTRGRISFSPATPRGSMIRGYKATCRYSSPTLRHHSWVIGPGSPLIVRNLRPGLRYACNVRAMSRAGLGQIARVTMPRFPA